MIGKVIPRHESPNIELLNDYVLGRNERGDDSQKVLFCGALNIDGGLDNATEMMEAVAAENRLSKNPFMHCLLSWREGELPSAEQAEEAVQIALEELGLDGHQCVWALHQNTRNCHVHISVNRIDMVTHRAIDAGGGFTHKAMERAARRVEYEQGWEVEKNAWSQYGGDGVSSPLPKTRKDPAERNIPQNVKDIENLTGEKSALRIVAEKMRDMKFDSWQELHERLAEVGLEYRKKGSGAVIFVGETPVKASAAGKRFGLNYLQKSLGPYQEPNGKIEKKPLAAESLSAVNDSSDWHEYSKFRADYYKARRVVRDAIKKKIAEDRTAMRAAHKAERDAKINSRSWVGHRAEMNNLRSELAAKHARERQSLKETHAAMKRQMSDAYPPLPTYEEWLRERDKEYDAEKWRHRSEGVAQTALIRPGDGALETGRDHTDIRGFATKTSKNGLLFFRPGSNANSFLDSGRLIKIYDRDESTMLASMQLGMAKWGCIHISGSAEYKARCVELAVEHGIKITNPELQEQYRQKLEERRRADMALNGKTALIDRARDGFRRYHEAIGADRYKVTATQLFPDGSKRGFMVNKADGAPDGFTPDELEGKMRRLVSLEISGGRNIYYTPISDDKHHLLIDDLTNESLAELITDGYEPNAIIESSPGNWQAVITIPKLGTDRDREIGNAIVARLNREYGDPKVSGEIHAHRAPGFENRKPKHLREDGTYPEVKLAKTHIGTCEKTAQLARDIYAELLERDKVTRQKVISATAQTGDRTAAKAAEAYKLHFVDLMRIHKGKNEGAPPDVSRLDAMAAVRLRATGYPQETIKDAIEAMAPKMREAYGITGTHKWSDYADRTAKYAFGYAGDQQIERLAKYVDYWKKLDSGIMIETKEKPAPKTAPPKPKRDVDWDR